MTRRHEEPVRQLGLAVDGSGGGEFDASAVRICNHSNTGAFVSNPTALVVPGLDLTSSRARPWTSIGLLRAVLPNHLDIHGRSDKVPGQNRGAH